MLGRHHLPLLHSLHDNPKTTCNALRNHDFAVFGALSTFLNEYAAFLIRIINALADAMGEQFTRLQWCQ